MNIICTKCEESNTNDSLFCIKCHEPLLSQSAIIQKLLQKQSDLEIRHQQELSSLKEQINFLGQSLGNPALVSGNIPIQVTNIEPEPAINKEVEQVMQAEVSEEEIIGNDKQIIKPERRNIIKEFLVQNLQVLEPVRHAIDLASGVYHKYKEEGKLPIFFMTITGIVAILFGVGYLMQYTMQYLGVYEKVTKVSLGFVISAIISGIGIRLNLQKKILQEYGSALISLGLILNYLLTYYLSGISEFPLLSSALFGFSLIIINTIIAITLAIKFETKIVSVLSLIGGALAPFYLNTTIDGSLYYLYLWFLVVGANYIAYKIKWQPLHYISFVVSMVLVEIAVFSYAPSSIMFNVYYHLFAYLFFYFTLFEKFSIKENLVKSELILLVSTLSFLLFNLYYSNENSLIQLGIIYFSNSLIFGGLLYKNWSKISKNLKIVVFVVIGSFIGLAIPSVFDQAFMGLFWSFEALALIIVGFIYSLPLVRKEGYLILCIAIFKLIEASIGIIFNWDVTLWHNGLINYIIFGASLIALWYILNKYLVKLQKIEVLILKFCKELIPIWASSIFLIIGYGLVGLWTLNLAIIPLFGLFLWQKKFNTKYSDIFAFAHLLLLLLSYLISVSITNSYYLSEQKIYVQLAVIEFLISLWFIQKFYEKTEITNNKTYAVAKLLRVTFYCLIPIIFVGQVKRHFHEFYEPSLWIGVLITYFLHKKLNYKALLYELYFILTIAFILLFGGYDTLALLSSIVVLVLIVVVEKGYNLRKFIQSKYQLLLSLTPYLITTSVTVLFFNLNDKPDAGLNIAAFILFIIIYFKDKLALISKTYHLGIILAVILNFIGVFILFFEDSIIGTTFMIVNLTLNALILINKKQWYDLNKNLKRWNGFNILLQVQIIVSYMVILNMMDIDLSGLILSVLLVFHAIVLLFVSLKANVSILNKSSIAIFIIAIIKIVLHDVKDFETVQKVIVFIVIGLLLLIGAYLYVKLQKHFDAKNEKLEENNN